MSVVAVPSDLASQLTNYKETVKEEALETIRRRLPEKILDLRKQVANSVTPSSIFHPSVLSTDVTVYDSADTAVAAKKRKLEDANGVSAPSHRASDGPRYTELVKGNDGLEKAFEHMRKEYETLISHMDPLKICINLLIPQIEDGDTFGVQVQEGEYDLYRLRLVCALIANRSFPLVPVVPYAEVLAEIQRAQESAYNLLDVEGKHLAARAKLASKLIKYPGVTDYEHALLEHDRKQLFLLRRHLNDLLHIYTVVFDMWTKNQEKLTQPKGRNRMSYG